jgi:hypothetical protein
VQLGRRERRAAGMAAGSRRDHEQIVASMTTIRPHRDDNRRGRKCLVMFRNRIESVIISANKESLLCGALAAVV